MKAGGKAYKAAVYLRLSRDDGAGESASISTQRNILRSYAREHGFEIYGEYVDDGWSGTNFDRPAWQRLLGDIEAGRVNLVLAKDLSRLGRDYIAAGQYTEIYFPSRGVRCIAVNDGYDSDSPYADIAPFRNVLNEMYARDTSKKIRSALRAKMEEGSFIGSFAPYGYRKDPENKNHLLVDYEAASVVREIFRMAEEGSSPSAIAGSLNGRGIPTPAVYRRGRRLSSVPGEPSGRGKWTSGMICKMLRSLVYLGHIAQGKTTKVSFKSRITLQNPRDDWIIAENMHEPLISRETFDRVQSRSVSRRRPPKTGFFNVFSGLAKCADCGRSMSVTGSRKKGSRYNLVCGGYKLYGSGTCSNHFIDYEVLYEIVLREIKLLLAMTGEEREELLEVLGNTKARETKLEKPDAAAALKARERELDRIIRRLYEDSAGGRLDETRFYQMLASYEGEQKELSARLCALAKPGSPAEKAAGQETSRGFLSLLNELTQVPELTPGLLHGLIDRIEICQGGFDGGRRAGCRRQTVRIYYKCTGPLRSPEPQPQHKIPLTCVWGSDATPRASSGAASSTLPGNGSSP